MGLAVLDTNTDRDKRTKALLDFVEDMIENKGVTQQSIAEAIGKSHTTLWAFRKKGEASESFLEDLERYKNEVMDKSRDSIQQSMFTGTFDFIRTADANNILGLCVATESVNGIGVVLGNAGTGKTFTLQEYAAKNPKAVYIRADCLMSRKELLKEIGRKIGATIEGGSVREIMLDVMEALANNPRVIIIDEIEQLMPEKNITKIEILRTIHDGTKKYGNSMIFAGPLSVEYKLKKRNVRENYGQIDSRIDYVYKTHGLSGDEIRSILSGFNMTESACEDLANLVLRTTKGGIRWLSKILKKCTDITGSHGGNITRDTLGAAVKMMMI
jgi:type II secretory pathway predicted ATPase ExeA